MRPGRETAAALAALGAYAFTVLPRVPRELRRWGPLPPGKARNAEAVAVFATLAPRSRRAAALRAIVALQVAIDLRDVREEKGDLTAPSHAALLERLEASWRREVTGLPAHEAVEPFLERAVERCEEGQRRTHAAAAAGDGDALQVWAEGLSAPPGYRWWEVAAGASSSVAAHALIAAAAASDTGAAEAAAIDAAYFPPIGALTVLLDDLVDFEEDRAAGEHSYISYYASPEDAAERLSSIGGQARRLILPLPQADRHQAILGGVAAFYLSEPAADSNFGRAIGPGMLAALGPGARLLAAFTRLRRAIERKRPGQAGNSPGP